MRLLVFGGNGWIGQQMTSLLLAGGHDVLLADARADNEAAVVDALDRHAPSHVLCLIGRTHGSGYNTIDYLEQPGKLVDNIRDNLYAPLVLALLCKARGIHLTYLGTGCIFNQEDPVSRAYKETDQPDFFGSSYSIVKGFTDRVMYLLDGVLNVRIRMPITAEIHPRNFITKITTYANVCSIPNSMTVLPNLLPIMMDMMERRREGTVNLTNPGVISHNEILEMYRDIVDPSFTWQNFTLEEQDAILASKRSNNQLDTSLLEGEYKNVKNIRDAVRDCLVEMRAICDAT
jgi:3,5-epimerase/4-reductase